MCGINGFTFSDRALIEKMNALVKHRGPDGDGVFVDDQVSLGHTRLAIIDLSAKGKQPMFYDGDNLALTFNGEIYNYQALRKNLKELGYKFNSETDSEVILAAYQEYGADCLKKFNGIFAFAIWNRREKRLFLARDHVGVKPLYYYAQGGKLVFSSEIKAILAHDLPRRLDRDALNLYLRLLYVPAPLTMFEGIKKLEPGSYLIYKDSKIEIKKYWQPSDFTDLTDRDEAQAEINRLMKDAVRLQLISDRPVGVFLSGGIDSTVIAGLASEITRAQVKTFSVTYDIAPEKFGADAALAQKTSKHFGADHHEFLITGKDVADNFEKIVYQMDEPVANATQIATYLLAKHTREQVVVGLGGDGGDELFGGYERYRLSRLISRFQRLPRVAQKILLSAVISNRKSEIRSKLNTSPGAERYLAFMAQKESNIDKIIQSEYNNTEAVKQLFDCRLPITDIDFEKHFAWADARSWLVDESLIRTDKMTMAWGLEQRVPILDYRLVELSLKIPTRWKLSLGGHNNKAIFKEAMRAYLPNHVLRQPKRGWSSPASEWLRCELKNLAYEALSPDFNNGTRDLFNFVEIKGMLEAHISKEAYQMNLLWALLHFQLWYRRYLSSP